MELYDMMAEPKARTTRYTIIDPTKEAIDVFVNGLHERMLKDPSKVSIIRFDNVVDEGSERRYFGSTFVVNCDVPAVQFVEQASGAVVGVASRYPI